MASTASNTPFRRSILGAADFIGGHIARRRNRRLGCVRSATAPQAASATADLAIQWGRGDRFDPASLTTAMRGCSVAVHTAAHYPRDNRGLWKVMRHEVTGMRNLSTAAFDTSVKRLV